MPTVVVAGATPALASSASLPDCPDIAGCSSWFCEQISNGIPGSTRTTRAWFQICPNCDNAGATQTVATVNDDCIPKGTIITFSYTCANGLGCSCWIMSYQAPYTNHYATPTPGPCNYPYNPCYPGTGFTDPVPTAYAKTQTTAMCSGLSGWVEGASNTFTLTFNDAWCPTHIWGPDMDTGVFYRCFGVSFSPNFAQTQNAGCTTLGGTGTNYYGSGACCTLTASIDTSSAVTSCSGTVSSTANGFTSCRPVANQYYCNTESAKAVACYLPDGTTSAWGCSPGGHL